MLVVLCHLYNQNELISQNMVVDSVSIGGGGLMSYILVFQYLFHLRLKNMCLCLTNHLCLLPLSHCRKSAVCAEIVQRERKKCYSITKKPLVLYSLLNEKSTRL